MKQTDIKRLEKAVEHLQKAQDMLSKTYDSLVNQPTEFMYLGLSRTQVSLESLVSEMFRDTSQVREYIEGKIKVFKEDFLNN